MKKMFIQNNRLILDVNGLLKYGEVAKITLGENILYEGEIDKYAPIYISKIDSSEKNIINIFLRVNSNYMFFDRYVVKSESSINLEQIEINYADFFDKVRDILNE